MKKHKYECCESTLDFEYCGYKIRLWINIDDLDNNHSSNSFQWQEKIIKFFLGNGERNNNFFKSMREVAEFCASLDKVNAVQVKEASQWHNKAEVGIMIYTVPFTDKEINPPPKIHPEDLRDS